MNYLVVAPKAADWYKLKALVLDSVSSPITRRVYNMALDEFMVWFRLEPRPGFSKATVSAWRASLEARKLGSSSIIIRMSAAQTGGGGGRSRPAGPRAGGRHQPREKRQVDWGPHWELAVAAAGAGRREVERNSLQ